LLECCGLSCQTRDLSHRLNPVKYFFILNLYPPHTHTHILKKTKEGKKTSQGMLAHRPERMGGLLSPDPCV